MRTKICLGLLAMAVMAASAVTIVWAPNPDDEEVLGYYVEYQIRSEPTNGAWTAVQAGTNTMVDVPMSYASATRYRWRIYASNEFGVGPRSAPKVLPTAPRISLVPE